MSNILSKDSSKLPAYLKEYLESANDASNRSRYISIILVIATILIFAGLNNEYVNSWMVEDLREVYKPNDKYISSLFGHSFIGDAKNDAQYFLKPCGDLTNPRCDSPAEKAKKDAQESLMKMHLESRLLIRIPILGVSIHVNDLGLIGGITLIFLLLLMRTSLSREIKNLNYSFKKAYESERLDDFYDALAMRQLFTVPHMKGERRNHFLSKTPYAVCLFPAFVYLWLVAYDVLTVIVIPKYRDTMNAQPLANSSILWLMIIESICALLLCFISLRCVERQHYVYSIWDDYWKLLKPIPDLCLLEPTLVSKLKKNTDYSVEDKSGVAKAKLSTLLVEEMVNAKISIDRLENLYLFRWLWRAFKQEIGPTLHFLVHTLHLLSKKHTTEKPLLIEINTELAELFSNDKEINDTLEKILKQREKREPKAN